MKRAAKTIECFNDIRKYLFEHKVPCLQFIRDGKVEVLYTQMYIDEKDKEIERLNNIIFNQNKRNSHQRIANDNLQNKNKELNNIINELEKGIKENIEELEEHQLSRDRIDEDKEILRFLQELKGSDKE